MSESNLPVQLRAAMESVVALAQGGGPALEEVEDLLMASLMRLGKAVFAERLSQEVATTAFDEGAVQWKPVVWSRLNAMTLFGVLQFERPLFRAQRNGPTRCLVSERLGLIAGWWTPRAARYGARLVALVPSRQAYELWDEGSGAAPSRSALDRLPKVLSQGWEEERASFEGTVSEATDIPAAATTVCVSLDGVFAHMRATGKAEYKAQRRREGVIDKGPKNYREVGCGVIDLRDCDGQRLQTRRFARMPESGKATLKEQLRAELGRIRSARPDLTVVVQADGATDNGSLLESLPHDYAVTDYYHAVEKLKIGLDHMLRASKPSTDEEHRRLRNILRDEPDGADQVLKALQDHRGPQHTVGHKTAIPYFKRHRNRMAYAEVASKSLPIGTGVMEGTFKSLVTRRLKQAGMRWDEKGGQAILTLNALEQSGQFNTAWPLLVTNLRRAA